MLQLASYGLPHRRQPCQADVYLLKHARITQAHERASPIRSLHFTAICHRLEELFPSCAPELKDSWVNVMCRKGSRCDRWAPRVSLSLCLRLLSKATVKYWAIRAFCQSESGVMGWGGGLRKRRIEARLLNSEAQRHNCQKSCSCTHKHTDGSCRENSDTSHSLPPWLILTLSCFSLSLSLKSFTPNKLCIYTVHCV